jgi:hypothetical protein
MPVVIAQQLRDVILRFIARLKVGLQHERFDAGGGLRGARVV